MSPILFLCIKQSVFAKTNECVPWIIQQSAREQWIQAELGGQCIGREWWNDPSADNSSTRTDDWQIVNMRRRCQHISSTNLQGIESSKIKSLAWDEGARCNCLNLGHFYWYICNLSMDTKSQKQKLCETGPWTFLALDSQWCDLDSALCH